MSAMSQPLSRRFRGAAFAAMVSVVPFLSGGLTSAQAYDITSKATVNVTSSKIALQSYDPVAYQTVGKPVLGQERFSAEHDGAIYRFSSDENLKAFMTKTIEKLK